MSEPAFIQAERRNLMLPVLTAGAALAVAVLLGIHFFPATSVDIAHVRVAVVPTQTVFNNQSMVVGPSQVSDVVYVAETLRISNELRVPLYLDRFTLTVTTDQGEETDAAISATDLATVRTSFPALEPLLVKPLLPETAIQPLQQSEGVVLFSLRMSQAEWESRRQAVVKVDLYHHNPVYQTIPKP